jgi:uncharacterized integral membrane protein (TIGR00698 family)
VAATLALLAQVLADQFAEGIAGAPALPASPVLCAVLLGMLWRNTIGVPAWCTDGLNWAMHGLLRTGIALVGLRLTLSGATGIAATALPVVFVCIIGALLAAAVIARVLGVPSRLATLLGVGTAVCGCTAVIAVSPLIRARHVETAFAVTCVVLFGCVAMLFYPWLASRFFESSPVHAGIFLGTAIHDTSQVIGAALIYSQQLGAPEALSAASVAKLLRNLSIAVLIPALAWLMHRRGEPTEDSSKRPRALPVFVLGFVLCIFVRTAGDALLSDQAAAGVLWPRVMAAGQNLSQLLLICGMTAVGLSVSFAQMRSVGWRPLAAAMSIAVVVGACSLTLTQVLQKLIG